MLRLAVALGLRQSSLSAAKDPSYFCLSRSESNEVDRGKKYSDKSRHAGFRGRAAFKNDCLKNLAAKQEESPKRQRAPERWAASIQVEIAERLFYRGVLGFLQAFGKFAREDVFFGSFGLDGGAEFCFDGFVVLAKKPRRVVQIDRGGPYRRHVGQDDAQLPIHGEVGAASGALGCECLREFLRHRPILRQICSRGVPRGE